MIAATAALQIGGMPLGRLLIAVSLGANLVMAVLLVRHGDGEAGAMPPPLPRLARFVDRIADSLPSEDARIFRAAFDEHRDELMRLERAFDGSRQSIRTVLRTRPFDPAALEAVIAAGQADRRIADEILRRSLVEAAQTLSPEGRRVLADGNR